MQGCIRQRSPGSWQLIWELPRGANGKRQSRSETVRGSKREAEARLREILLSLDNGTYIDKVSLTVAGWLEEWLRLTKSKVAPTTHAGYESYCRQHLMPRLGRLKLAKLTPVHIEGCYTAMLEGGRKDGRGQLSPRTVKHAHVILHTALARAVRLKLRADNPCDAAEPPRVVEEELHSFTEGQVVALLAAVRDTPLSIAVVLAIATGCRRGELCGLRWSDIDFDGAMLTVRRASQVTKGTVSYKEPKTRRSRRAVPLPSFAVEALRRHKQWQELHHLRVGDAYIVTWEDGRPLHPDYISKVFGQTAARLGLPTTRFHALRHTCASVLLKADVHPKVVSEILGHDDVRTTLNRYSHLLPGLAGEAARKLDDAMRRAGVG